MESFERNGAFGSAVEVWYAIEPEKVSHIRHGRRIRASVEGEVALVTELEGLPVAVVARTEAGQWRVERGLHWTYGPEENG